MSLPVLNIFEPLYKKYKSVLLYLFFGVLTTFVSIVTFAICTVFMHMNVLTGNVISWICAVSFAYVTNRTWVFDAVEAKKDAIMREIGKFFAGRFGTLVVEEAILLIFVEWLKWPGMGVKIAAQFIVIVLNYVISKLFVFNKK